MTKGVEVGDLNVNGLLYVDDAVLIAFARCPSCIDETAKRQHSCTLDSERRRRIVRETNGCEVSL